MIRSMIEVCNQECTKIENGSGMGPKFETVSKMLSEVISVYKQIS